MQGRRKSKDATDLFTVAELISTMTYLIPPLCKNLEDIVEYFQVKRKTLIELLYSWKIWWGIKFGDLAVYITTTKLKFAKISYSHVRMAIRTELPNLNPLIAILGSTAKFNSRQYFWYLIFTYIFINYALAVPDSRQRWYLGRRQQ
ncbi:MAG: hypothetical protein MJE68_27875 [Proteobacteria bacterium]|nr:hypothetical protein [Pseudomonadota bacterium]